MLKSTTRRAKAAVRLLLGGAVVFGVAAVLLLMPRQAPQPGAAPKAPPVPVNAAVDAPAKQPVAASAAAPQEALQKELKFLPASVNLPERKASKALEGVKIPAGNRKLKNVRPLTDREKNGLFLRPRFSPDGMQVLASRPGFDGIYLISLQGGDPIRIADGNGYYARWTPEGLIEVKNPEGDARYYTADGTLTEAKAETTDDTPVFAEDNVIYTRTSGEAAGTPLTGSNDQFFNPVVSPDGTKVVYRGLNTGLFMQNIDGSGEPLYLGSGNNATWLPDSTGVVFDVTADDGHHLTAGDIYFATTGATELTNLTTAEDAIAQTPSVSPDGNSVAFEAEGTLYVGDL